MYLRAHLGFCSVSGEGYFPAVSLRIWTITSISVKVKNEYGNTVISTWMFIAWTETTSIQFFKL